MGEKIQRMTEIADGVHKNYKEKFFLTKVLTVFVAILCAVALLAILFYNNKIIGILSIILAIVGIIITFVLSENMDSMIVKEFKSTLEKHLLTMVTEMHKEDATIEKLAREFNGALEKHLPALVTEMTKEQAKIKKTTQEFKRVIVPYFSDIWKERDDFAKDVPFKDLRDEDTSKMIFLHTAANDLLTEDSKIKIENFLKSMDISIFIQNSSCEITAQRVKELKIINELEGIKNGFRNFVNTENVKNKKGKITVYEYETIPYFSAIISENENKERNFYLTHHIFYKKAAECPTFHIDSRDKFYDLYNESLQGFLDENEISSNIICSNKI